ncbi:MAG: hypothetical protein K2J13_04840 [Clostridia bacterium]|nr:hypothetical protein [Clostridia bacterium]
MENNLSKFCVCKDHDCPFHPTNHDKGCTPCIAKNIKNKEIPSCFFNAADGYPSKDGYTFEAFAKLVLADKNDK